jgi:hypothetical protein
MYRQGRRSSACRRLPVPLSLLDLQAGGGPTRRRLSFNATASHVLLRDLTPSDSRLRAAPANGSARSPPHPTLLAQLVPPQSRMASRSPPSNPRSPPPHACRWVRKVTPGIPVLIALRTSFTRPKIKFRILIVETFRISYSLQFEQTHVLFEWDGVSKYCDTWWRPNMHAQGGAWRHGRARVRGQWRRAHGGGEARWRPRTAAATIHMHALRHPPPCAAMHNHPYARTAPPPCADMRAHVRRQCATMPTRVRHY